MSKLSIKDMVDAWVAANPKVWEHDRTGSLGASSVGRCLRLAFFERHEPDKADQTDDDYGYKVRGDILERHLWVPAIEHAVRQSNSLSFLYGGEAQISLVSGFLSATPDGLLTGVDRDCLKHLGVLDILAHELVVEAKSIDPRVKLLEAKPEHVFQVQVQMGLTREVTAHRPEYALISYVDASCVSLIHEFPIRFDADAYAAAKARARRVFAAHTAAELPPEGRLEGGKECKFCSFHSACGAIEADAVPEEARPAGELPAVVLKNLAEMVMMERAWRREKKNAERQLALTQDGIKQVLREAATRSAAGSGWSISYSRTKGRKSLDTKALVAAAIEAGIDVTQFERAGSDADRLTVKVPGEGNGDGDDDDG
jgi:hypothetical protein